MPSGAKLEVLVRGPNRHAGYWKAPDLTRRRSTRRDFYLIGDAVKFADAARPELGCSSMAASAEDFKAKFRYLGQRRHAARRRHIGACAVGAENRRHRPWRRRGALSGVSNIRPAGRKPVCPDSAGANEVIGHEKVRAAIAASLQG